MSNHRSIDQSLRPGAWGLGAGVAVGLACFVAPSGASATEAPVFAPPSHHAVLGLNPSGVAIGDLNGDGRPDLATADTTSDQVTVLTQDADGGFTASLGGTVGDDPPNLAIADFTGDGALDIATIDGLSWRVSLLDNGGSGPFSHSVLGATAARPINLAVGDINGDGRPDIATANWTADPANDTVTVLLSGSTPGTYAAMSAGASAGYPMGIALGDVDGDGRIDVITVGYTSQTVEALLQQANGSFTRAVLATSDGGLNEVQARDLNGDGLLDLVINDQASQQIRLLTKNASGAGYAERVLASTSTNARRLAIGDINHDGAPDIVVAEVGGTVSALINDRDADSYAAVTLGGANGFVAGMTLGDVDGDGRLDVATANPMTHTVTVMLNRTPVPDPVDPVDPIDEGEGEETPPTDAPPTRPIDGPLGPLTGPTPGPVVPEACPLGGLELVGVAPLGSKTQPRVRLTGVAEASLAGRSVTVLRNGARAGTTTVPVGGAVTVDVAAPKNGRSAARARYQLVIDGRRSRALLASRRATVSTQSTLKSGQVRLRGTLAGVKAQRVLTVRATPFCGSTTATTRRVRSDRRGRFSVTLAAPAAGTSPLVYRVFDGARTVTLPVVVAGRG